MGRWQSAGLTEGLLALPSQPLHRFAVPLPVATRQGGNKSSLCRRHGEGDRREAVVEGRLAQRQNQPNHPIHNSIDILQNLSRSHPHHNKPLPPEPLIAQSIPLHPSIMRQPIHLDDHPRIRRIKIRHIGPHRMLPPKLHPSRPQAQPLPQQDFRRRQNPPQPPRHLDGSPRSLPHPTLPPNPPCGRKAMGRWQPQSG